MVLLLEITFKIPLLSENYCLNEDTCHTDKEVNGIRGLPTIVELLAVLLDYVKRIHMIVINECFK